MAGNRRDVETDIIGRDRFSAAAKSAAKGAEQAKGKIDGLKSSMGKLSTAGLALGAAVAVAARMMDRGLAQALSKATAEVALGEKGYAALSSAAERTAHSLGLSRAEFIASAGQTARLTKNLGFSQEEAARFGSTMPGLAAKLSLPSAGAAGAAEASDMMSSALAGEFDPLQRLGIAISAARVEQEAANIAKREGGRVTEEQAKALAVLEIVTRQTADATKVSATAAGQQARKIAEAKAQLKEFADTVTANVLPALAGLTETISDNAKDTGEAEGALHKLWGGIKTAGSGWEWYWNWLGEVTGETEKQTAAAQAQVPAVDAAAKAAQEAAAAQDRLYGQLLRATEAQMKQAEVMFGARSTARDYQQAIDDAAASVKENGRTLDITTDAGRKNQGALDGLAQAAMRQREAMLKAGASQEALDGHLRASRDQLIQTGIRMGMTRDQAKRYADVLGSIPEVIQTGVVINTSSAMVKLDTLIARLALVRGQVARVTRAANSANEREGRSASFAAGGSWGAASGGRVGGPAEVNVTTSVMLDGAPFYALTKAAVVAGTDRAAHRARVGRR